MRFEVLVVGGGPAGIAAAALAAECGRSVAVLDENGWLGGQIWRASTQDSSRPGSKAINIPERWQARLSEAGVKIVSGARVVGSTGPRHLLVEVDGRPEVYGGDSIVLATGARERFLPFPGWTLPNVLGAGALQALAQSGLPIAGKRVVVAGSGPLLVAVAAHLTRLHANVEMILEQAPFHRLASMGMAMVSQPGKLAQGIRYRWQTLRIPYRTSAWPLRAQGRARVESVSYRHAGREHTVPCDFLACGFHLVPNIEIASFLGCALSAAGVRVDDLQQTTVERVYCAGEVCGVGGLELALVGGQIAGLAAAGFPDRARMLSGARSRQLRFAARLASTFAIRDEIRMTAEAETIVCRCEDVRRRQLDGQRSWRAAKLLTRCGMGPCQGRICGAACEFLYGWKADFRRLPVQPVRVSGLMGSPKENAEQHVGVGSMHVEFGEESE